MTTIIGPYTVYWAEWLNANNNNVRLILNAEGNSSANFPITDPFYTTDIVNSGIPIRPHRPSNFHSDWDDVNNEWNVDYTLFNKYALLNLASYRDMRIQGTLSYDPINVETVITFVPVIYNNGVDDFVFNNTLVTRRELHERATLVPIVNDPNFTAEIETSEGYKTMTGSDIRGAYAAIQAATLRFYDAASYAMGIHAVTPFEFYEHETEPSIIGSFEEYLANN